MFGTTDSAIQLAQLPTADCGAIDFAKYRTAVESIFLILAAKNQTEHCAKYYRRNI